MGNRGTPGMWGMAKEGAFWGPRRAGDAEKTLGGRTYARPPKIKNPNAFRLYRTSSTLRTARYSGVTRR